MLKVKPQHRKQGNREHVLNVQCTVHVSETEQYVQQYICAVMSHHPNDEVAWINFLALPLLLFTQSQQLTTRQVMDKLALDDWQSFFLSQPRPSHLSHNDHTLPTNASLQILVKLSNLFHLHLLSQVSLQQRLLLFFKPNIHHATLIHSVLQNSYPFQLSLLSFNSIFRMLPTVLLLAMIRLFLVVIILFHLLTSFYSSSYSLQFLKLLRMVNCHLFHQLEGAMDGATDGSARRSDG